MFELRPLDAESGTDLLAAAALFEAALPWDHAKGVAAEKLFSGNGGRRRGYALGGFDGGVLIGALAMAGRWIKLLAVHPEARRRGIGSALLEAARRHLDREAEAAGTPRPKLRIGDHSGNYLSPGVDVREEAGQAFLRSRGFVEVARNMNLRAPLLGNPCLSDERTAQLERRVDQAGYAVRRATAADVPSLLELASRSFSPVWAHEVSRALGPELGGAPAAHTPELFEGASVHLAVQKSSGNVVGFAAHDGNNRGLGWFGPTGVLLEHRGHGAGELMLLACLRDVLDRPDGGVIAWVGPVEYYARACGARPDRHFVVYEES